MEQPENSILENSLILKKLEEIFNKSKKLEERLLPILLSRGDEIEESICRVTERKTEVMNMMLKIENSLDFLNENIEI